MVVHLCVERDVVKVCFRRGEDAQDEWQSCPRAELVGEASSLKRVNLDCSSMKVSGNIKDRVNYHRSTEQVEIEGKVQAGFRA